jgi:ABC-type ATPase involved in cell division
MPLIFAKTLQRLMQSKHSGLVESYSGYASKICHCPRINYSQLVIANEMTVNLDPQAQSALLDLVLRLKEMKSNFSFVLA